MDSQTGLGRSENMYSGLDENAKKFWLESFK